MAKFKGTSCNRGEYDANKMKEAVNSVIEDKFSIRIVAESILTTKEFLKLAFDLAESLLIDLIRQGKTCFTVIANVEKKIER
jgi:hypothetical protein